MFRPSLSLPALLLATPLSLCGSDDASLPNELPTTLFDALVKQSPFTRQVDPVGSLILTGWARLDGQLVATLLDTESLESQQVGPRPNAQGLSLLEILPHEDPERSVAVVALSTGQTLRIRRDASKMEKANQQIRQLARWNDQGRPGSGSAGTTSSSGRAAAVRAELLSRIDATPLPKGYNPGAGRNREESARLHQSYVDRRMGGMSAQQRSRVSELWTEKQVSDPRMPNRGASFVRIMEHVAENTPR